MRAIVPNYKVIVPDTLKEALQLLNDNPHFLLLAGGTDIMVMFERGKLEQKILLDISRFSELKKITVTDTHIHIGALATFSQIAQCKELQDELPNLVQAAKQTGAIAIQNRGTLGGNIANASPAGDSLPALLVYDAQIELTSFQNIRQVVYSQFHTGYKKTVRSQNEIITKVSLVRKKFDSHYFRKVGTRNAQAISKIVFAGVLEKDDNNNIKEIRIAIGSAAPIPLRCVQTELSLLNKKIDDSVFRNAGNILMSEIMPIDDIRSTEYYRRIISKNLLSEFLENAGYLSI